jgi:hypothetical protein
MNLPAGVDVMTSPEAGPDKGCSVVLSSDPGSSGSDPKSNSYAESEQKPKRVLESEAWPGAVSESELYSGTGSLPARREEGASVRALLTLRGPRVECSRGGETTCDG